MFFFAVDGAVDPVCSLGLIERKIKYASKMSNLFQKRHIGGEQYFVVVAKAVRIIDETSAMMLFQLLATTSPALATGVEHL